MLFNTAGKYLIHLITQKLTAGDQARDYLGQAKLLIELVASRLRRNGRTFHNQNMLQLNVRHDQAENR